MLLYSTLDPRSPWTALEVLRKLSWVGCGAV